MAYSHFNGVRAHHNFFVCSWFIIVQNQSFVHKSFIWSQSKPYLQGSICTSISMTKTLCSHGSHDRCGRFRNQFRCCATLIIMLRFINLIKLYCPPTQILHSKQFFGNKKHWQTLLSLSRGKNSQLNLWDNQQRHSSDFGCKLLDQNLKKGLLGFIPMP